MKYCLTLKSATWCWRDFVQEEEEKKLRNKFCHVRARDSEDPRLESRHCTFFSIFDCSERKQYWVNPSQVVGSSLRQVLLKTCDAQTHTHTQKSIKFQVLYRSYRVILQTSRDGPWVTSKKKKKKIRKRKGKKNQTTEPAQNVTQPWRMGHAQKFTVQFDTRFPRSMYINVYYRIFANKNDRCGESRTLEGLHLRNWNLPEFPSGYYRRFSST